MEKLSKGPITFSKPMERLSNCSVTFSKPVEELSERSFTFSEGASAGLRAQIAPSTSLKTVRVSSRSASVWAREMKPVS